MVDEAAEVAAAHAVDLAEAMVLPWVVAMAALHHFEEAAGTFNQLAQHDRMLTGQQLPRWWPWPRPWRFPWWLQPLLSTHEFFAFSTKRELHRLRKSCAPCSYTLLSELGLASEMLHGKKMERKMLGS